MPKSPNVEHAWSFDPFVAAAVLRELAEITAELWFIDVVPPTAPGFACAVGVLTDAKEWLDRLRSPFEYFAGDVLLMAARDPLLLVGVEEFRGALLSAALELVTVARLLELRQQEGTERLHNLAKGNLATQLGCDRAINQEGRKRLL